MASDEPRTTKPAGGASPAAGTPREDLVELARLLDALPDLVLEVDGVGRIWRAHGAGRGWFAQALDGDLAAVAVKVTDVMPEHPARVLLDAVGQASEAQRSSLVACSWPQQETTRWLEMVVVVKPPPPDGRFVAVLRDVTERKRAEQERAILERNLRHNEKMKSVARLAGGVSNDMNNILGAIMGFASSLRADIDEARPSADDIERIIEACWKGYDLATDLGNIAAERHLDKQRVSLNDSIRDVIELLEQAIPPGIVLRTELSPREPNVKADPAQITQILVNLALNAIDAMPGSGMLTFSTEEQTITAEDAAHDPDVTPGRHVLVEIADTGNGMRPNTMEHAFEPFFTTKPVGRAPGLGLPMVHGMVVGHGGTISLASEPGRGTTVRVYLPVCRPDSEPAPESVRSALRAPPGATALVVDDEDMMLAVARRLLERLGFTVLTASSGAQAVEICEEQGDSIAFVLLDLIMPVMDGAETFARIRKLQPDAPVIITSGYSKEKVVGELLEQGALGFLPKPFDLQQLAAALHVDVPRSRS